MTWNRIQQFVARVRRQAKVRGCQKCRRVVEVGIMGDVPLSHLAKGGDLLKIKAAIREKGWYCRKCVRKSKGTAATTTLRDQFPPTPEGEREYHKHLFETEREKFVKMGWNVQWDEDGSYGAVLPPAGEPVTV